MEIFWFLPTSGDGRYLGQSEYGRLPKNKYIQQIAISAENLGYDGLLIPTGSSCLDPWVVASSLATVTSKIKLLVALRTVLGYPSVFARSIASLDEALGGRLLLNIVAGGDPVELAGDGVFLSHDERYYFSDEYLTVLKQVLEGKEVNFDGNYIKVKGAKNLVEKIQNPYPPLYIGGSSSVAHELAAKHVDVYLTWAEPLELVANKIEYVKKHAINKYGREVRFGLRSHVIVRETEKQAWNDADELISKLTDDDIKKSQEHLSRFDSVGQKRMSSLHNGSRDNLVLSPNLWAGVGLVRGGAGTALVGSSENVYARIKEYKNLGIDTFIFSGYPHLEEAYRFAELMFPLIPDKNSVTTEKNITGGAFDLSKIK